MNKRPGRPAELSIGGLAAQSGCNIETIRYYERIKLMAEPPRTASGRRRYGDQALRRLRFIRRSREPCQTVEAQPRPEGETAPDLRERGQDVCRNGPHIRIPAR